MQLKCFDSSKKTMVRSYNLNEASWLELIAENRARRHLRLKEAAALAVQQLGWEVDVEVEDQSPDGEAWIADVLACRGAARVAIEIQWSHQSAEELRRRQARYQASGVRGLWLIRKPSLIDDPDIPVGEIRQNESGDVVVCVGSKWAEQRLSLPEFLKAAFSRRLKFGLVAGCLAEAYITTGKMDCHRCGAATKIVTYLNIDAGSADFRFHIPEISDGSVLQKELARRLTANTEVGQIKPRYSNTQERSYLSNGCAHCDALIGQFYEYQADNDEEPIASWVQTLDERWLKYLRQSEWEGPYWGFLRFQEDEAPIRSFTEDI